MSRFKTPRTATVLLGLVLTIITVWVFIALQRTEGVFSSNGPDLGFMLQVGLPFPVVGWIIARRDPGNALGWLFLCGPLLMVAGFPLLEMVDLADPVRAGQSRPAAAAWFIAEAVFFAGASLIASQFLVRFPTGRPPSRRWRLVTIGGMVGIANTVVWALARPCVMAFEGELPDGVTIPSCASSGDHVFARLENPFGIGSLFGEALGIVGGIGSGLVVLALLLGAVSLFVRYRRAESIERAQLRWLLAAVAVLAPVFTGIAVVESVTGQPLEGPLGEIVITAALLSFPTAIGVAITRYRLFDIDRLISRTATYGVVVVVLAALFGVLAAAPTLVVGSGGTETPAWVVAVSTLAVAALFTPLRRRVQRVVDRRFDRARYDAQVVVDGVGIRLRDATDLQSISGMLGAAASEVFRPSSLGLWVRGS